MRELEYPFDAGEILAQKRALRQRLLEDGTTRLPKRIAVLGGSTTADIVSVLELFLLHHGIEPTFYESDYAQCFQDALFPPDTLLDFRPDLVFIHTTSRNIMRYPSPRDTPEDAEALLSAELSRYTAMWRSLEEKFGCPIIQNNFEPPLYRLMGSRDCYDPRGRSNFLSRLNDAFYDYARTHESFHIHDIAYLAADFGLREWSNPLYWNMYKYALCPDAIPPFSFSLSNIIKSIYGKNKKALALDLDNTLWGGVVGDDGVEGIEIGQETGVAQTYYEFQRYLKEAQGGKINF